MKCLFCGNRENLRDFRGYKKHGNGNGMYFAVGKVCSDCENRVAEDRRLIGENNDDFEIRRKKIAYRKSC